MSVAIEISIDSMNNEYKILIWSYFPFMPEKFKDTSIYEDS